VGVAEGEPRRALGVAEGEAVNNGLWVAKAAGAAANRVAGRGREAYDSCVTVTE
jgi:hypothetical protein